MDEALIKRVPPHSIEAEQSVVGAMLMDRDAITVAAEIICGDDFYQKAYRVCTKNTECKITLRS